VSGAVRDLGDHGFGVAAIMLDPLLTHEGMPALPDETLTAAIQIAVNAGGLYIADEVQGGLGRTGRFFWAHQRYAISPDIITVGKSLANGMPIGAVITSTDIVGTRIPTAAACDGGAAMDMAACAAAQATLEVLETQQLREAAARVGAYLHYRLAELIAENPLLGEVRGEGLHQTLEVIADRGARTPDSGAARRIAREMARRGVLVSCAGIRNNLIRIRPSMLFALEHVDLLVNVMREALRSVTPQRPLS
jgi:4-aminobutyrate aminotransferase-like enzyme